METWGIKTYNLDFPNFSLNYANFPNDKAKGPIPKKVCESPGLIKFLSMNLIETVLLSTHNMFWLRNKKINFELLCTLISLTCLINCSLWCFKIFC